MTTPLYQKHSIQALYRTAQSIGIWDIIQCDMCGRLYPHNLNGSTSEFCPICNEYVDMEEYRHDLYIDRMVELNDME